jgi:hypothetical protein
MGVSAKARFAVGLRFPRKPLRGGLNGMTWPLCSIGSGAQICPVIQSIGMRPEWRAESQPVALLILFDIAYHAAGLLPHLSDSNSGCTNEDVSPRHSVEQLRSLHVSDLASSAICTGWQVGTKSPVPRNARFLS